jgi:putative membrane protein
VANHIERDGQGIDRNTKLAYDRTNLAYQRTMLAWVRTGTSLITFGFAIYTFHRIAKRDEAVYLIGPHQFALIMVVIGLAALVLAMVEHRRNIRALRAQLPDIPQSPLPATVALLVSGLGTLALVAMILRQ